MADAPPPDYDEDEDIPSVRIPAPHEVPGKVLGLAHAIREHRRTSSQAHRAARERAEAQERSIVALSAEVSALREMLRVWLLRVVLTVATGSLGVVSAVGGGMYWVGQRTAQVEHHEQRIEDLRERVRDLEKGRDER